MPGDAEFKKAAGALVKAWLSRLAPAGKKSTYGWPLTSGSDRLLFRRMLYLALASGYTVEAGQIARVAESTIGTELTPAIPGMLVYFRQFEAAQRMLKVSSRKFYNYDKDGVRIGWDYKAGVYEALPEFLAKYENAAERFRAEVILRNLPDIQSEGIGGPLKDKSPDCNGRMLALAKSWPGDEVLKQTDASLLLARLLAAPGADEVLAPVLERWLKTRAPASLLPGDGDYYENAEDARPLVTWLKQRVAAGDADAVLKFFRDGQKTGRNGSLPYGNALFLSQIWASCLNAMKPVWPRWDEETRHRVQATAWEFLTDRSVSSFLIADYGTQSKTTAAVYLHLYWLALASGKADEFERKVEQSMRSSKLTQAKHLIRHMDTAKTLDAFPQPWDPESPEARQKRSGAMMSWILKSGELPGDSEDPGQWFHRVIKAGWLTTGDVLAKADEVITARDRKGVTVTELLQIAIEAKDEAAIGRIVSRMKADALKDEGGVALLRLSEKLRNQQRVADAIAVLEVFTEEKIKNPKTAEEVRRHLPVKRVHLPIELAWYAAGMDEGVKTAAAIFTAKPEDPVTWEGVSWAWFGFACESRDAGDHEEARRRFSFAFLAARTGARLSKDQNRGAYGPAFDGCTAALKALNRDPKLAEELKTAAGAARLAEELGPRWQALPETARKRMLE
jgi:hypothetical protein